MRRARKALFRKIVFHGDMEVYMKGKQFWLSIVLTLCVLYQGTFAISAEQISNTDVNYVPIATLHEMQVIIVGDGCYKDGNINVCTSNQVYQLKQHDIKTFKLYPTKGYQVKSVLYDGESLNLIETNKVQVSMKRKNTVLIFTFEKKIEDEIVQKPIPPKDPPNNKEPPSIIEKDEGIEDKDITSVITKKENVINGDIDEFLNRTITGKYTILSHNVQNKKGKYEVVVQLEDGSIQTIQVEIDDDLVPKSGGSILGSECKTHYYMISFTTLYCLYFFMHIIRKKIGEPTFTKKLGTLTLILIVMMTGIQFVLPYCAVDNQIYIMSCIITSVCTSLQMIFSAIKRYKERGIELEDVG